MYAPYLYFIIARVIGLSARPALLFYFVSTDSMEYAGNIALIYLYLAGVMILFSVPVHFDFYKKYFGSKEKLKVCRMEIEQYALLLTNHFFLIVGFVLIFIFIMFDDKLLASLVVFLLISEKVFDEIQRFMQFAKNFTLWSNVFIIKSIFPLLCVVWADKMEVEGLVYIYIFLLVFLNLIIFYVLVPPYFKKVFSGKFKIKLKSINEYYYYFKSMLLDKFLLGVTNVNIINADKWILSIFHKKLMLTEVMMISQVANGIPIAASYAFMSHRRAELVGRNNLKTLWLDFKVPLITATFGFVVGVFLIFALSTEVLSLSIIQTGQIISIIAIYTLFGAGEPIHEYLFWNGNKKKMIFINVLFFIGALVAGIFLIENGNFQEFYFSLVFLTIFRLLAYIKLLISEVVKE